MKSYCIVRESIRTASLYTPWVYLLKRNCMNSSPPPHTSLAPRLLLHRKPSLLSLPRAVWIVLGKHSRMLLLLLRRLAKRGRRGYKYRWLRIHEHVRLQLLLLLLSEERVERCLRRDRIQERLLDLLLGHLRLLHYLCWIRRWGTSELLLGRERITRI